QAEDGIRDFHVTGVQTCALPILSCCSIASSLAVLLKDAGRGGKDALMKRIFPRPHPWATFDRLNQEPRFSQRPEQCEMISDGEGDRKSTRLNSSHVKISYAVFCL